MATDRRTLLKGFAAAAASMTVVSTPALARSRKTAPSDAVGLLYDATKCVGCKACVVACKESAGLPADTRASKLYDAPEGLNEFTKNVIQLAKADSGETSYVKKQCMHCVDPTCVGACMLGALPEGKQPACTEVCPRKAVIFGPYDALLDEAHARLKASPNNYVQKVYGEKEL